jgi:hypothetical protein
MQKYFEPVEMHEKTFEEPAQKLSPIVPKKTANPFEHLEQREKELNSIRQNLLGSKDTKQKIIKVNKETETPQKSSERNTNETVAKDFIQNLFK